MCFKAQGVFVSSGQTLKAVIQEISQTAAIKKHTHENSLLTIL